MAKEKPQFKVLCADEVQLRLEEQRKALGFNTNNSLASVYLTALSDLPAERVWEVLAIVNRYKITRKNPRKALT